MKGYFECSNGNSLHEEAHGVPVPGWPNLFIRVTILCSSCTFVRSGARSDASLGPFFDLDPTWRTGFFRGVHHTGELVPP